MMIPVIANPLFREFILFIPNTIPTVLTMIPIMVPRGPRLTNSIILIKIETIPITIDVSARLILLGFPDFVCICVSKKIISL